MKFLKTKIENFLTIGDSGWLLLDGRGLVLVQGVNEDDSSAASNGAGKSSILDAICWCLYGETARGESGDAVVNDQAKKNARVINVIQDGDSIYEITRHRKHKDFKNSTTVRVWNPASTYPTGAHTDLAKGTEKETNELIVNIIGSSLPVFVASIYAGQEAMPDLPRMTDKQLKLLIEEAAGVERLEGAYKVAAAKENDIKRKLETVITKRDRDNAQLASLKATLHTTEGNFNLFEAQRPDKAAAHEAEATAAAARMRNMHAEYMALKPVELQAEQTEINAKLAEHGKFLEHHRGLMTQVGMANVKASNCALDLERAKRELAATQRAIENAPAEMAKPCTECGKPHTPDELETFKAHLAKKAAEQQVTVDAAQKAYDDAHAALNVATEAANAYAATIPDVSALSARNAEITATLRKANDIGTKIKLEKTTYDSHKAAVGVRMSEPNPHQSGIDVLKGQIATTEANLLLYAKEIETLEVDLDVAACVTKVFSPAGVRAHILDTVTPFLNERTSDYLNALSDGNISAIWSTLGETAKGEVREKFNIDVSNDKGAKSFAGLSGGEKRKVRLATMLALQDLVASRAAKPIDLYMADEIDDALDEPGIERLMGILEGKARERGTVIVVSHNELRDWIDQVVTVTKSGGKSRVEGALCEPETV